MVKAKSNQQVEPSESVLKLARAVDLESFLILIGGTVSKFLTNNWIVTFHRPELSIDEQRDLMKNWCIPSMLMSKLPTAWYVWPDRDQGMGS